MNILVKNKLVKQMKTLMSDIDKLNIIIEDDDVLFNILDGFLNGDPKETALLFINRLNQIINKECFKRYRYLKKKGVHYLAKAFYKVGSVE